LLPLPAKALLPAGATSALLLRACFKACLLGLLASQWQSVLPCRLFSRATMGGFLYATYATQGLA